MNFEIRDFYNFIETHRLDQGLSTTKLSKLAMPDHHSAYYPTNRNTMVGSAFVVFSALKTLQFTALRLTSIVENVTYKVSIDITLPLTDILEQLLVTARLLGDKIPYGEKVERLGKMYSRIYTSKTYPTLTTFCKIFRKYTTSVEIIKGGTHEYTIEDA